MLAAGKPKVADTGAVGALLLVLAVGMLNGDSGRTLDTVGAGVSLRPPKGIVGAVVVAVDEAGPGEDAAKASRRTWRSSRKARKTAHCRTRTEVRELRAPERRGGKSAVPLDPLGEPEPARLGRRGERDVRAGPVVSSSSTDSRSTPPVAVLEAGAGAGDAAPMEKKEPAQASQPRKYPLPVTRPPSRRRS